MLEKIFNGVMISLSGLIALGIGTILLYAHNDFVKETMDSAAGKIAVKIEKAAEKKSMQENELLSSNDNTTLNNEVNSDGEYGANTDGTIAENSETKNNNIENVNTQSTNTNEIKQEEQSTITETDDEDVVYEEKPEFERYNKGYLYSPEVYFNIEKNRGYGIDQEQLDIMKKFNTFADEMESKGVKQKDMDYGVLSDVKVTYYDENTYINPYEESPLKKCYAIEGMPLKYYVDLEYGHVAKGTQEWEVVLNNFMEAILSYMSVKEAKKFVDIDSAYLMAEPGEDVYSHTKYTDKCIVALLVQAASAYATVENSNGQYVAQGSYYLDNIVRTPYNGTEIARATMKVLYIRVEPIEVPAEKVVELDPSRTYISSYVDDANTGKKYCYSYTFASRSVEVSMAKDTNGDWKIVCLEP